ncbi:hypothetical protein DEDE109153_06700 [Deinococcus deserti]|uniref:Uncharacterized protein n=1 Tax=Deinococcus deserti (strain DSM 17065 / CIP 109153 / LMG 22923 / VCD115) TaxID=546414 RepID=C1CZN4_DEIDV|nr:hypothetical protein [Deinococcus deserti]ACO47282.1 Hypothetical protein Deide_22521 [Deinococcus deserti VCD115]
MTAPIKFGRQATLRPPFYINERTFASTPLSLAEEKALAAIGADPALPETELIEAMLGVLADLLNVRAEVQGAPVTTQWLMENLTPGDLEGIVEYLRSGVGM